MKYQYKRSLLCSVFKFASASNLFYFSINSPNTTLIPFELFSCLLHFRDDESKDKTILNGYLIGFIKCYKNIIGFGNKA